MSQNRQNEALVKANDLSIIHTRVVFNSWEVARYSLFLGVVIHTKRKINAFTPKVLACKESTAQRHLAPAQPPPREKEREPRPRRRRRRRASANGIPRFKRLRAQLSTIVAPRLELWPLRRRPPPPPAAPGLTSTPIAEPSRFTNVCFVLTLISQTAVSTRLLSNGCFMFNNTVFC